jgi:hypothetical protein
VFPYIGLVNAGVFEGKPPGTVLFVGPQGAPGLLSATLVFVYRPEGWNTFFSPETQRWEDLRHAVTREAFYRSADFGALAAMKAR